jgi:hypothetical protein
VPNIQDMFADTEPLDENDPAVLEEMFEQYKYLGWKPADLGGASQEYRAKYGAWLESQKA